MGAMDRFLGGANGQEIPVGYRWTFANSTARAATNDYLTAAAYASTDIGKEALQQSDNTLWLLTGTTPTWTAVSQPTTNASLLTSGTVADARLSANVPLLNANNTFTGVNSIVKSGAVPLTIQGTTSAGQRLTDWRGTGGADLSTFVNDAGGINAQSFESVTQMRAEGNMLSGGSIYGFNNASQVILGGSQDLGISRLAAGSIAFGNGSAGDISGTVTAAHFVGDGSGLTNIPVIKGSVRQTGQTAAATLATYTVGGSDGSFLISANVLITTRTTFNFTVNIAYTDETNTSRSVPLNFSGVSNSVGAGLADINTDPVYCGIPSRIRAKAGTTITVATSGTFTTVVYNAEADITQVR